MHYLQPHTATTTIPLSLLPPPSLRYALLDEDEGGSEELQDVPASAHRYSRPVVRNFHIEAHVFGNKAEEHIKVSQR